MLPPLTPCQNVVGGAWVKMGVGCVGDGMRDENDGVGCVGDGMRDENDGVGCVGEWMKMDENGCGGLAVPLFFLYCFFLG